MPPEEMQTHQTEQGRIDDPRSSSTMLVGVVGTVLLVVTVVWVQAIYNTELHAERAAKQVEPRVAILDAFRARQAAELESYGWIDREQGTVHVPIERAMALTVRELSPEQGAR